MKINDRGLTLLAAGAASLALLAPLSAHAEQTGIPRLTLSIEGRYLSASSDSTDFVSFLPSAGADPIVRSTELDDGWSGRIAGQYGLGGGWDVGAGVTASWLDSDEQDFSGSSATLLIGDPVLLPTTTISGNADSDLDYFVIDVEAGHALMLWPGAEGRVFAGLRYADFDHDISTDASGTAAGGILVVGNADRSVDYWGIGPRLGASGAVPLGNSPFSIVAGFSGAALFGDRKTHDDSVVTATVGGNAIVDEASDSDKDSQTAYNLEGELGISYRFSGLSTGGGSITAGWHAEGWWNVNDTDGTGSGESGDHEFDGPFLRLTAEF